MARLPGRKRRSRGAKRLDLTDLKHAMKDDRVWLLLGTVYQAEGQGSHFEIVSEDGQVADILVDVQTHPDNHDFTCRLGGMSKMHGILTIPAVGDEVIIAVPSGEIRFQPTVVALLSSNELPEGGQGPAANRTIICNGEVFIHDGSGGAEPLVKKSEFETHQHPTGVGPSGSPIQPIIGTEVLKAK